MKKYKLNVLRKVACGFLSLFMALTLLVPALQVSATTTSPEAPVLTYQTHVQRIGWQNPVGAGQIAGTYGQALRLEGLRINLNAPGYTGDISYRVHVQGIGWMPYVGNGALAGTTGRALRLEAIQIRLSGELAEKYDIYYRVHVQGIGWMPWARNDQIAGTSGQSRRMEAMVIELRPRNADGQTPTPTPPSDDVEPSETTPNLSLRTHQQSVGWSSVSRDNQPSGTTGRSLRMEAMELSLNIPVASGGIEYNTHIQNIGWQGFRANGALAGTTGRSLRMEALQVRLTGLIAAEYNVFYRAYVQNHGWLGWTSNGQTAGSVGFGLRIEAVQITLVHRVTGTPPVNTGAITTPTPPPPGEVAQARIQGHVNQVHNQVGRTLMANYWWVVNNLTWVRLPIHVTPPAGVTRAQNYAIRGFEQRTGNCFVFAATFYQLARGLGYNARYVEGTVGARGGGRLPHGWVEIQINGNWYIFDPEAQRSIGGHNFFRQPIGRPILSYRANP